MSDFGDIIRELKRYIRNLPREARDESSDIREALEVVDSIFRRGPRGGYSIAEVGQRARRIKIESQIEQLRDFKRRSDALFEADEIRSIIPGLSGMTASQIIATRKKIEEIKFPNVARMRALKEKYGDEGAIQIQQAERERAYKIGLDRLASNRARRNFTWWHDNLNEYDLERFGLTQHYGGGEEGARMADEKMRQRADRRHREAASRASISTRKMRLEGAAQFPMWRRFFKDSRNQASDIRHMYRTLHKMSKVPIVGRFMHMGPAGIAMSAGLAGAALLSKYLGAEDDASKKVTKWENAELFYGKPSKAFAEAAKNAGIADPGQQAAFWGKFSQMGIPPEIGMAMVGNSVRGGDPVIQRVIGETFGLSPEQVVASRFFTGELSKSEARDLSKNLDALGVEKAYGMAAGGDKLRGIELSMPFSKDIEARTGRSLFSFLFDAFAAAQGFGENPFEQAKESARSLNTASANSASQSNRGSSDTYIYVNGDVRTDAENVGDLAQDIENRADIGIRREVIEMFDSRKSR